MWCNQEIVYHIDIHIVIIYRDLDQGNVLLVLRISVFGSEIPGQPAAGSMFSQAYMTIFIPSIIIA
jgi:hypothetical protein